MEKRSFLFYLRVGGILLLICALIAAMLAGVNQLTKHAIAAHKLEKINTAIHAIFADGDATEASVPEGHTCVLSVYTVTRADVTVGACYVVSVNGFGGALELMVGIDTADTIRGIEVIDHNETSGIGSKVLTTSYLASYFGKNGPLSLGQDIDAYTGATVTSKAVLNGVQAALAAHNAMQAEGGSVA